MKTKLLSAAIAAVSLAGFSQGAFAIAPNVTPDIEIYMSGATAQDKAIRALFINLCGKPNAVNPTGGSLSQDLDIYATTGATAGHVAYFCTLKTQSAANPTGVPNLTVNGAAVAQATVLLHKRSAGGSAQGVNPLIAGTPIAAMPVNAANCAGAPVVGADGQSTTTCTSTVNVASDAGISDVEPAQFIGANVPFGSSAVTSTANITVQPAAALLFGVPVTTNLYVALQKVQGLLDAPLSCTPGAYTDACMPSLSKEQIATLTAGKVASWTQFMVNYKGTVQSLVAAASNPAGPTTFVELGGGAAKNIAPTNTQFHYCKRVDGSGTNAVHNINFLHNPCLGAASGLDEGDWNNLLGGRQKHEVSGSSDIENCLTDFSNGTNLGRQQNASPDLGNFTTVINTGGTTPPVAPGATGWAIGQQSMENNAGAIPAKNYRFIKIDGVAPTLENAFRGKYMHWSEPTYQWRNDASVDKRTVVQKIATDAASPAVLASDLNPTFVHAFGASGYLANGNNFAFTHVFNPASPVMPYSHAADGAALNNCKVPVMTRANTAVPANNTNRPIQ
ncbi:MAG: hypothetical protein HOP23_11215 [Methylococcaceae bacterium]|nr:hypothetical protein [Methylococcaceae bacterium]